MTLGTKWKPHKPVEFKHVVEVSERIGRMSDDSMLLGRVWNELQCAKGRTKTLEAAVRAVREAVSGEVVDASDVLDSLFELVPEVKP